MDMTWIMDRIAVGGGIESAENMEQVARAGITHIINMQIEFNDSELAAIHGIKVLNNGVYNDFEPKPAELFQRGVEFGTAALRKQNTKLLIHCRLGMHRAPTMALALLCAMGWPLPVARQLIERCRPVVYFCDNYINSVEEYLSLRDAAAHLGTKPEVDGAVQTA